MLNIGILIQKIYISRMYYKVTVSQLGIMFYIVASLLYSFLLSINPYKKAQQPCLLTSYPTMLYIISVAEWVQRSTVTHVTYPRTNF